MNTIICQTLSGRKTSKGFSIIFWHSAPSAEPEVSGFILGDAPNLIICQTLSRGKIGKGFPIIFGCPATLSAEPKISRFIHKWALNSI